MELNFVLEYGIVLCYVDFSMRKNAMRTKTVTSKKAPHKEVSARSIASITEDGYGSEPAIGADLRDEMEYRRTLTLYSITLDPAEGLAETLIAMKGMGYKTDEISAARRSGRLLFTINSIAKIINRKCKIAETHLDWFRAKVDEAVIVGLDIKEAIASNTQIVAVNIPLRTANKAKDIVIDIESALDRFIVNRAEMETGLKPFEIFNDLNVKPAHIKTIVDHFTNLRNDLLENLADDCKGLSRVEIATRRRDYAFYAAMYDRIIEGCKSWTSGAVTVAKPKKVSEKAMLKKKVRETAKKQAALSTLKFKQTDNETGLVSIKPGSILGAHVLYTYNTRYSLLTKYSVQDGQELSVKGTTILNYDENLSSTKRCGRAIALIKQIPSSSKPNANKLFNGIKGSVVKLVGRTGEDTILLGAYK